MECAPDTTIVHTLLSCGTCRNAPNADINEITALLQPLGYTVVLWPENDELILNDLTSGNNVLPPWTEEATEKAKSIFEKIAMDSPVPRSSVVELLVESGWIAPAKTGGFALRPRTLVQFKDFIRELNGRYSPCKVCGHLVGDDSLPPRCKSILARTGKAISVD